MRKVYMDTNATSKTYQEVIDAMLPFYGEIYGNASSIHMFGQEAKKHMTEARKKVAELINAESQDEIIFTSGGTESDNFAVKGITYALAGKGKHIITSKVEHHAVFNTCRFLEKNGFEVTYIDVDKFGIIDLDQLKNAIREDTVLITVMAANNETGTIMPIEAIGKIANEKGIKFHIDAVQYIGKLPFDVKKTGADLVSISAHKFNGPKGIGALYIKKGTKINQYQHGGHHERNLRSGTENIPAIVGFGKACEIAACKGEEKNRKVKELRDYLHKRIEDEIKHVRLNGHPEKRLPNTLNISFEYLEGESIILNLDLEGIAVSTGSACTSGSLEPSHVLMSMGVEVLFAQGSVRFSLDSYNTKQDIDYVMEKLPPIIERLRKMSPVYKGE